MNDQIIKSTPKTDTYAKQRGIYKESSDNNLNNEKKVNATVRDVKSEVQKRYEKKCTDTINHCGHHFCEYCIALV